MKVFLPLAILIGLGGSVQGQPAKTWKGFITDTHCGTHCQRTSTMRPDLHCVRLCVKRGSKYGLWVDDKVYEIEPQQKVAQFAAEDVRVTGQMTDGVIHISSITRISRPKSSTSE